MICELNSTRSISNHIPLWNWVGSSENIKIKSEERREEKRRIQPKQWIQWVQQGGGACRRYPRPSLKLSVSAKPSTEKLLVSSAPSWESLITLVPKSPPSFQSSSNSTVSGFQLYPLFPLGFFNAGQLFDQCSHSQNMPYTLRITYYFHIVSN